MESLMELKFAEFSYVLNTFYLFVSACLVMWMAAGFCMLESGLVRTKNTVEILTKNVSIFAISCLSYFAAGYAIMYDGGFSSLIPSFGFGIGEEHVAKALRAEEAPSFSLMIDFFFQSVFVATAMSIVSGAVAERMKLLSFLLFAVVMSIIIYPVVGYWVWGGGILSQMGFSDFAGSGVVHFTGATAALAGAYLTGARLGKYDARGNSVPIMGANLPLATLGTLILWLGWFGFNGGSQLAISSFDDANAVAKVLVNTNMAASAGWIGALFVSKMKFKKYDLTMSLNGVLAGLVGITAAPDTPSATLAAFIGLACGMLVVFSIILIDKMKIDDPVGAISVHGVIGALGVLLVPLSKDGTSFVTQLAGLGLIFAWVGTASFVTWKVIDVAIGLRVTEEEEREGGDLSEFGITAYPEFGRAKQNN